VAARIEEDTGLQVSAAEVMRFALIALEEKRGLAPKKPARKKPASGS
jgi:hypothetical protein